MWGAAASLAWLNTLVDFGTGQALVTLVAREVARDQLDDARRHVTGALALSIFVAGPLLACCAIFGSWDRLSPENTIYLIAIAGLAINLPVNSANNIWMALQEGYYSSLWELIQTILTTCALVATARYTQNVALLVALVYAAQVLSNYRQHGPPSSKASRT